MSAYSNVRAMRALIKASLQAIFKSPSAIIFSLAFPLIFIMVFGFLGSSKSFSIHVAAAPGSDTTNAYYRALQRIPILKWTTGKDSAGIANDLKEGDIVATINVKEQADSAKPKYKVLLNVASTQQDKLPQLQAVLNEMMLYWDPQVRERIDALADVDVHIENVRDFKMIDFILPGQLGFSLLAAGVFGTAFVFFNMRQTLVLKRFFATPVSRSAIVLSEGIARMVFQMMGAVIIIGIGHFVFHYTLVNGWVTFFQMLAVCALAMMVFMGFGFIISSLAKNESSIPPFSNLITLPQFLLAGTFFPIDNFPKWLQPICKALPLTYLNDALRKIAFDGAGLWDVRMDILVLFIWGIVVYAIAAKLFKWE